MMPLQVEMEPLWLLLALDPGHPHSAHWTSHTQSLHRAYAFPQRAPTWRACVYTHARRARTGYSRACTHSKGTEVLHVHTHTAHNLYVYMYAHAQRTTQRPRLGLKEGRPSGWMLASQLFLSSVKQPGHHLNLHFPLCPALHLSTFSQPAWLPSFPPGSWHQR